MSVNEFRLDPRSGDVTVERSNGQVDNFSLADMASVDLSGNLVSPSGAYVVPGWSPSGFVDIRDFGVKNDDNDYSEELRAALQQAADAGIPVLVPAGWTIRYGSTWAGPADQMLNTYSIRIQDGGGIVCLGGECTLESHSPDYKHNLFQFRSNFGFNEGQEARNLWVEGVRFRCATLPSTDLDGGALEPAGFLIVNNIDNVIVNRNKFQDNYGLGALFRSVRGLTLTNNVAKNVFKDNFHSTGRSKYHYRINNESYGSWDDAFAAVGYDTGVAASQGQPEFIYDISNRVYGTRGARGITYVGARHVRNHNCFVDGRVPDFIPQRVSSLGWQYNTNCGLYIASESSFGTVGNEDIRVTNLMMTRLAPTVDSNKVQITTGQEQSLGGSNSLAAITVDAGRAGYANRDIHIQAFIRDCAKIPFRSSGSAGNTNVTLKLDVIDNTDPRGIRGTPGSLAVFAADIQNTNGLIDLEVSLQRGGSGVVTLASTCGGSLKVRTRQNDICRNSVADSVQVSAGASYESVDIESIVESNIPDSGAGSQDRVIDFQANAVSRRFRIGGSAKSVATDAPLNGPNARTYLDTELGASSQIFFNASSLETQIAVRGGTGVTVKHTRMARRAASAATPGANGTFTVAGQNLTSALTAGTTVVFINDTPNSSHTPATHYPGTATVVSSALVGSDTVVTCSNVPAQFISVLAADGVSTVNVPAPTYWREVGLILPWSSALSVGNQNRFHDLNPSSALLLEYTTKPFRVVVHQVQG